jgi:hypothetical protein
MRLRTFYDISVLLPLLGLGIVAVLTRGEADLAAGPVPGTTAEWLYPRSAIRGFVAYGIVALWLLRELRRRRPMGYKPLLWLAPLANAAANVLLFVPLALIHGGAGGWLSEHAGRVGLRLVVRLIVGFGYVGLVMFVRQRLQLSDVLETEEQAERSADSSNASG